MNIYIYMNIYLYVCIYLYLFIQVSLFDAPSDSMAVLRTELTLEKTSAVFRRQVRELRSLLAAQLKAPMLFAGIYIYIYIYIHFYFTCAYVYI
jgi:hypothetical protein